MPYVIIETHYDYYSGDPTFASLRGWRIRATSASKGGVSNKGSWGAISGSFGEIEKPARMWEFIGITRQNEGIFSWLPPWG